MTLPMVTCPLCCRPGFSSSDSLCTALVDATTRKLSCPICNHEVSGLDKFTIHLFSHYLSRLGYLKSKDTSQINTEPSKTHFDNNRFNMIICNDKNQNSNYDADKLRNINNNEETVRPVEKQDSLVCNNLTVKNSKSIPNDPSLIYFRSDNGQLFALSQENLGPNLKNVTINTQNYITSTNITTSTVQTNLIGNIQKRKYCQIIDKDSSFTSAKCVDMEGGSPEELINNESTHSWTSVPSNSSDVERSTNENVTNENKFESCKDLLTKGDFSTNNDELNDLKTIDSNVENKNNDNQNEKENKLKENTSCNLCSYVFPNKIILAMHNQLIHKKNETEIESKRKLLLCNQCPRTFNLRSSLMIHRKVAHAGGFGNTEGSSKQQQTQNLTCQMCGKFFNKDVHLTQHMKVHDEKQWQCSICAKGFTTKYFLKKHRRLHTGEMPYRCKTCSKSFTFQQTYRKHLLYHNNDKPYCCAQCGRLFKELSTLHNHERIHSGEKPFSCETCDVTPGINISLRKSFRQRVSYLVHRRIHTGAMPYKCTACNKSFRYKISQRTHKCTAQPPGVVVRTQGYLVHRLQAAMNKAAEINGCNSPEKDEKDQNTNGDTGISAVTINAETGKSNPTLLVPESPTTSEDKNNITINNDKLIKTADLPKMKVDKPQIYLLVRGPNGETYYQPLILSSQNVLTNSSPIASTQNGIYLQTNKIEAVASKCSKLSVDKQNSDNNKTNLQNFINVLDKKSTILTNEINPNEGNNMSFGNTENKTDDRVNNLLHTENIYQETNETTMKVAGENNVSISTSSLMSDLFNNLEFDNEIIKTDNTPSIINKNLSTNNQNNNTDNNSDSIMDSSDLFSFMLSPSLSSPSDRFGRLSLSPNSSINNSLNSDNYGNNSSPNINSSSLNNPPSLEDQQDIFFENMSDDTLKELLFGSVK